MRIINAAIVLLAMCPLPAMALSVGDTQGEVVAVKLLPVVNGVSSFQVWFSQVANDRFGCIQASGFITVTESGSSMSPEHFKRLFATALAAQAAGKPLALDSAGSNPCFNVNMAWMVG